jgi:hypothetical protein
MSDPRSPEFAFAPQDEQPAAITIAPPTHTCAEGNSPNTK